MQSQRKYPPHPIHAGACGPDCPDETPDEERPLWEIQARKLAREHWEYLSELITIIDPDNSLHIGLLSYLYRTAFVHGYKHCNDEWRGWDGDRLKT